MRLAKLKIKFTAAMLACLASASTVCPGRQAPAPTPQFVVPTRPPKQDPFDSLITSAASFDFDSPVTAKAEFDPPMAVVGQRVVYRVEVSALDESLKMPDNLPAPPGLELHAGGHAQTYQHTAAMKLQPRTTYLYHLTAGAAGTFTMPPFNATAYGKAVKVPPVTLTVGPKSDSAPQEPAGLLVDFPSEDVYVGQLLRAQLILPDNDGRARGFNKSQITGEFVFSEPLSFGMRRETIQRDGKSFPAYIEEALITPLREGPLEIIAQAFAFMARPVPNLPNVQQTAQVLIDSDPVTLKVKGLPAHGRLPGFTGAVGNFTVDTPRLSTTDARAGEPLTLTVTLRGNGNLGRLIPPPAPSLPDWQVFPPASESIPPSFIQQRGFVNFTYTLIPLNDRSKATPPIPFSYFNPFKKTYVDLTVPPVPLTIEPGLNETNATYTESNDSPGTEREPVLTGLAKEPGHVIASLIPLQQQTWFLLLQIVPAAMLGGLWFWDLCRRYREQHPEVVLKRRARRGLRRQLRLARRAAAAGDAAGFAARATSALREACAPHSAANPEALVCADVLRELPEPDRINGNGEIVRRLFAAADAHRFGGPDRHGKDLLAVQPQLEQLLEKMKERL